MNDKPNIDLLFHQLILSMHVSGMQQMGKVTSPITGNIERNLSAAKMTIDVLTMLQEKTTNNLTDDEKKLLDHALYELRMNYVDEAKKGENGDQKAEESKVETPVENSVSSEPVESGSDKEPEGEKGE